MTLSRSSSSVWHFSMSSSTALSSASVVFTSFISSLPFLSGSTVALHILLYTFLCVCQEKITFFC
nr:MAG TPA: hypothetical protein [Caudoviricetes sp.]